METALVMTAFDGALGLRAQQIALLARMDATIWDAHSRQSKLQLEQFVTRHREFPGHADKYHHNGLELLVRFVGITEAIRGGRILAVELAELRARARWLRGFRWLPAVRRRLARCLAEAQYREARLRLQSHDLSEYFREVEAILDLRAQQREAAIQAGESLDFDRADAARWLHRLEHDPKLAEYVAAQTRPGFREELAALVGAA